MSYEYNHKKHCIILRCPMDNLEIYLIKSIIPWRITMRVTMNPLIFKNLRVCKILAVLGKLLLKYN